MTRRLVHESPPAASRERVALEAAATPGPACGSAAGPVPGAGFANPPETKGRAGRPAAPHAAAPPAPRTGVRPEPMRLP